MGTAHLNRLLLHILTHPPSRMGSTRALPLLLETWATPIQQLLQVQHAVLCNMIIVHELVKQYV